MDPSIEELQSNEVEAIRAIYIEEFEPLKPPPSAWKVVTPNPRPPLPSFRLRLRPTSEQNHIRDLVFLDLEVRFTRNYPRDVPELALGANQGVAASRLPGLLAELRTRARSLRGQEMVYELATFVTEWLDSNHTISVLPVPPAQAKGVVSSFEKMKSRHAIESERRDAEQRALEEARTREREREALAVSRQLDAHLQREQERRERVKDENRRRRRHDSALPGLAWYQLEGTIDLGTRFHLNRVVAVSPDDPDSQVFEALLVVRRLAGNAALPSTGSGAAGSSGSGDSGNGGSAAAKSARQFHCTRLLCVDTRSERPLLVHLARTNHVIASAIIHQLKPLALTCSSATFHPHICTLYDFLLHHEDDAWAILALEEPCDDGSLEQLLAQCRKLDINVACTYAFQLLGALGHLHETTAHGCLDLEHVLVSGDGALKLSCATAVMGRRPPKWADPWCTDFDDPKGCDVYHVALAFLVMIAGTKVLDYFSPSSLLDLWRHAATAAGGTSSPNGPNAPGGGPGSTANGGPSAPPSRAGSERGGIRENSLQYKETRDLLSRLPKSLKDTLTGMLTHNHRPVTELAHYFGSLSRRIQASALTGGPGGGVAALDSLLLLPGAAGLHAAAAAARGPLHHLPPIASAAGGPGAAAAVVAGAAASPLSRYRTDFEELEYIGRGGFGQVVKARNRLDGRVYAIKTVPLSRDSNDNRKLLREVRTLSRLNSSRCVRYYQAWVEDSQGKWVEDSDGELGGASASATESETESSSSGSDEDGDGSAATDSLNARGPPRRASRANTKTAAAAGKKSPPSLSSSEAETSSGSECESDSSEEEEEEDDWISYDRSSSFVQSKNAHINRFFVVPSSSSENEDDESESSSSDESGPGGASTAKTARSTKSRASSTSSLARKGGQPASIANGKKKLTRSMSPSSLLDPKVLGALQSPSSTSSSLSESTDAPPPPGKNGKPAADSDPTSATSGGFKTLYIQMEYCENRTLSDVIEHGLTVNEAWRLFRQIVEGLVHIHAQGMIHRDLKPKNIFLDSESNVKIGDFGLATTFFFTSSMDGSALAHTSPVGGGTAGAALGAARDEMAASLSRIDRSLTGDIGTAMYTAPEVRSAHVKYGQKVDMYSLGIIFFEMLYSFSTGMERVHTLRDLRSPEVVFPAGFPAAADAPQRQVIAWLLSHDPAARPTSLELLQCHLLPTTMEDEYIQEAMRTLTNPNNTVHYSRLMHALFEQPANDFLQYTYDERQPLDAKYLHALTTVQDLVTRTFRMHGAAHVPTPLMAAVTDAYSGKRIAQFIDPQGNHVMLPYNLTVPFAQYVARNNVTQCKRFAWGHVYRENGVGGQPRAALEADFDIVCPIPRSTPLPLGTGAGGASASGSSGSAAGSSTSGGSASGAVFSESSRAKVQAALGIAPCVPLPIEAEVIQVTAQVLDAMPPIHRQGYHLVINHTLLVDALLRFARVPEHQHQVVITTLDQTYKSTAAQIRARLQSILTKRCVEELMPFIAPQDLAALRKALAPVVAGKGQGAVVGPLVAHLDCLIAWLRHLGVACTVLVAPLLTYNYATYRGGIVFQARLNALQQRADVVASGGRYDYLIARSFPPGQRPPSSTGGGGGGAGGAHLLGVSAGPAGMGMHLAVQKLAWIHQQHFDRTCTQVLVASYGVGLLAERMRVAREMWQAGIPCEFLYEDSSNVDVLMQQCKQQGIAFCVFVKGDASGTVKVRNVRTRTEVEQLRTGLVDHLLLELTADPAADASLLATLAPHSNASSAGASPLVGGHGHGYHGHGHGHHGLAAHHHASGSTGNMAPVSTGPVSIVTPPAVLRKMKHKQKQQVMEKAASSVTRCASDVLGGPVVAVYSLSLDVLKAIAAEFAAQIGGAVASAPITVANRTAAAPASAARQPSAAVVKSATDLVHSNADRDLVAQVRSALAKFKSNGHRVCFLYAVHQDAHCLAPLN
ncbi:eukaryotic translation initiation factor 2-alpha kinase [Blastocladiella emersonii ATCC 22665]|nr:eukaryotic translation initiation factor 2-alpha kinase [Blastocladiella emersonii ATCC 22665]